MHVSYRIPTSRIDGVQAILKRIAREQAQAGRIISIHEDILTIATDSQDLLDASEQIEFVAGMFGLDDEHLIV